MRYSKRSPSHLVEVLIRGHEVTTNPIDLLKQLRLGGWGCRDVVDGAGQRAGRGLIACRQEGRHLGRDLQDAPPTPCQTVYQAIADITLFTI